MRTIKELLQLLLDNKQHFEDGLCIWVCKLSCQGLITYHEYHLLMDYFEEKDAGNRYGDTGYWWTRGDIEPRLEWINEQIKLLSNQ